MSIILHVVRHGRVPNYETDQALTAEGREETLAVGRALAALVEPGEMIRFFSSPARRARETAALLHDSLQQTLAETNIRSDVAVTVEVDDRLQNNQFYLNGAAYDPIVPLLDIARWRVHTTPSPEHQAFLAYQTGFWEAPDPVTYWLTEPNPTAEAPEAVINRLRAWLAERLAEPTGHYSRRRDIGVTHSANMRAFLRQVLGRDPGPPIFSGMLTIRSGQVIYQGQTGELSPS